MSKNTVNDQIFRAAANARIGVLASQRAYLLYLHNAMAKKLQDMETRIKMLNNMIVAERDSVAKTEKKR